MWRKRVEAEKVVRELWEGLADYCFEILLCDRGVAVYGEGIEAIEISGSEFNKRRGEARTGDV